MTREAFKVVTTLEIKGNALKEMQRFALLTRRSESAINNLTKGIKLFNTELKLMDSHFVRLNPHAQYVASVFRTLNTSTNLNNRSMGHFNMQLERSNEATVLLAEKVDILGDSIKKIALDANMATGSLARMGAASRISEVTGMGGTRRIGSGRSRGGHYMPYHGMSHVMGSEGAALFSAGRYGGPLLMGGIAGAMLMRSGFEKSTEYGKMVSQLQAIGFTPDQVAEAQRLTSQSVPGVSPLGQMQALLDAQMATRKFSDAKLLAPTLQKMQFISKAMFSGFSEDQLKSAVRIAEIRGGADPNKVKEELSTVMQMYTTSAGTINPTDFLAFFRRYQGSSRISREGLLALEPTIQEIKPTTVATALQTMYMRLHGGVKLSNKDSAFFSGIGLMKNGRLLKSYSDILDQDPEKFFEKVWLPLLAKHGINTPDAIARANVHLGNTPSRLFATLGKNTEKAERAREQGARLLGIDSLMKTAFQTQSGAALRFMQALESLVIALGKFSSPTTISMLNTMAFLMERMAKTFGSDGQPAIGTSFSVRNKPFDWNSWNKSPIVSPTLNNSPKIQGDVHLDGHKVGKVIMKNAADALNRGGTQSAPGAVNPMMTPQPTGLNNYGGFN